MTNPNPPTHPPSLAAVLNFRDIALSINPHSPRQNLQPNLLYRSARLDKATERDLQTLQTHYQINTILNLRTPTELASSASPVSLHHHTRNINLNGAAYSSALLKHLSWPQTLKLYALYALGFKNAAIAILGRNVMTPRGLTGLAIDTLAHSTSEIKAVFAFLATAANYPVLIHCTQGKDRTGLVVVLVLLLLGVDQEAIEKDYCASEAELLPERTERLKEIRAMGLDERFAGCEAGFVRAVTGWLGERWGGVEGYLGHCGVGREEREGVRAVLLEA
ncbi:protein-tyrosine phosphatase [Teratosphaeria nubilosa]|uniref:Protein-tyrosine phosphatase n=1 Tax=Teratosphaeria nubilosa TaxID=161662 RepID=A0A6G1L3J1_9PEZI|nr:protein-tyrosine phosphatase [Teratosphaeria nubilosa]